MSDLIADLRAEADELRAFLCELLADDWSRPTPFMEWTPWDVVAHLYYFDMASRAAIDSHEAFEQKRTAVEKAQAHRAMSAFVRGVLGEIAPQELIERWHTNCHAMADQLADLDPQQRLPWFGPDMGVRMHTTARFMETWAHGQDIYDLARVRRPLSDRIKNVAVIGVRTFQWSFAVRGLEVPGAQPHVRLFAPSGAIWEWNDPCDVSRVEGPAVDFCRVVSQCRNVADTDLVVVGQVAQQWMKFAQCFAGVASDPPRPGERAWERV